MPLAVAKRADPIGQSTRVMALPKRLSMLADGITEMSHTHAPVVAHEPFHWAWANQLDKGNLERFRQRLHDVCTHVVHGPVLDEGLKILHEIMQLPHGHGTIRSSLTRLRGQLALLEELPMTLRQRASKPALPLSPNEGQNPNQNAQANNQQYQRPLELDHSGGSRCTKEQAPTKERTPTYTDQKKSAWELHCEMSHGGVQWLLALTMQSQ